MNELYHAKRSHKYVAKIKGAGKGGRPLYFYTAAAYRSYLNGLKDKTGLVAKLKTKHDGSVTGVVSNAATKISHAFDKITGSKRTLSTVKSPSARIVRQTQTAVAKSGSTKVRSGNFSSVVESIKQAVGYNEYTAFKSASKKRAVAENKYKNQQGQYRAWKDFHEGGKAGKYPNALAERRGRQNLNNEKRWTRARGAELRDAKATENAAKKSYANTLMGRVDNLFGGIKGVSRPQAVKTKYSVKRNEAHELAGRLRRKGQPVKTEDSKTLADGTAFRSRKKRVTANNGQGVKKRARVNSQYLDPANEKGVPPKTLISLYKTGKITKQQALDYIDPSNSGNSYDMGTQWRLEQIIKTGEDPYDKAVKYAAARQANAKKKAKRRGEDTK